MLIEFYFILVVKENISKEATHIWERKDEYGLGR